MRVFGGRFIHKDMHSSYKNILAMLLTRIDTGNISKRS